MPDRSRQPNKAVIFAPAGLQLSDPERFLFERTNPFGFILFARNCQTPDQVRRLVESLRSVVGRDDAPILIDQEGGRVQRLRPPYWRDAPSARTFGQMAEHDEESAVEAAWLNARLIADELVEMGITVDCAPVLDVPCAESDPIIGDRAFADTPERVALLGRAACAGFLSAGVLPVIKHIPGHGRARVDSHLDLPIVSAGREELQQTDWAPFLALCDMPWAMTAHIRYPAIDERAPATLSPIVIDAVIRGAIGFDGVLVSDDIGMGALSGSMGERADAAVRAGCDVVLHCSGSIDEMTEVAETCPYMTDTALRRVANGEAMRSSAITAVNRADILNRLSTLVETNVA